MTRKAKHQPQKYTRRGKQRDKQVDQGLKRVH